MYICMCLYFHPTGFSQWALSSFPAPAWNSTRFVFTRHIFLGEDIRDNCHFFLLLLFGISYCQSLSLWVQIKTSSSNPPIDGEGGMRVNPCIGAHPTTTAAHPAIHLFLIIISIRPAFPCNGYWKVSNRNISWVTSHALALHLWCFAQRKTYFPCNHHIVPLRQNHIHINCEQHHNDDKGRFLIKSW